MRVRVKRGQDRHAVRRELMAKYPGATIEFHEPRRGTRKNGSPGVFVVSGRLREPDSVRLWHELDGTIHVESPVRLNTHSKQVPIDETRTRLIRELRGLVAHPGQVLYGCHTGPSCDLPNVLVYDAGAGAFASATRYGLCLERGARQADWLHRSLYRLAAEVKPFHYWRPGREIARTAAPLPGRLRDTSEVWYALKTGSFAIDVARVSEATPLLLDLTIEGPQAAVPSDVADVHKALFDGTTCTFQFDDRRDGLGKAAARIATRLAQPLQRVLDLLADPRTAPLGRPSAPLVAIKEDGTLKWDPCDERFVSLQVRLRRIDGNGPGRLYAVLYEAKPVGDRGS